MISSQVFNFLMSLKENNSKDWFDANRKQYDFIKKHINDVTTEIIKSLSIFDETIVHIQSKECLFRINRDIRFSADKSPYKTNIGISINKGGKKFNLAGYYIHLQPNESFVGGGIYMPMPPELKKIREEIDYNFDTFQSVVNNPAFEETYKGLSRENMALSRVPKGYETENPAAEFLKLKGFIATKKLSDEDVLDNNFVENVVSDLKNLTPLIHFINNALEG